MRFIDSDSPPSWLRNKNKLAAVNFHKPLKRTRYRFSRSRLLRNQVLKCNIDTACHVKVAKPKSNTHFPALEKSVLRNAITILFCRVNFKIRGMSQDSWIIFNLYSRARMKKKLLFKNSFTVATLNTESFSFFFFPPPPTWLSLTKIRNSERNDKTRFDHK